jgi:hypothetical protein
MMAINFTLKETSTSCVRSVVKDDNAFSRVYCHTALDVREECCQDYRYLFPARVARPGDEVSPSSFAAEISTTYNLRWSKTV